MALTASAKCPTATITQGADFRSAEIYLDRGLDALLLR